MSSLLKEVYFHSRIPMTSHGRRSWYWSFIFDFGTGYATLESDDNRYSLSIWQDGSICGVLAIHSTQHEDINMLCPYGPHPSVIQRTFNAMEIPENYMVLKVSGIKEASGVAQGILVHAVAQLPLAEIPYAVATMAIYT